jgi:hypothetical protein
MVKHRMPSRQRKGRISVVRDAFVQTLKQSFNPRKQLLVGGARCIEASVVGAPRAWHVLVAFIASVLAGPRL